ncbi:MAG TPA: membrane protein insertase YidC, partial [Verrucomicrobiae bacterium]|nr:membrane protein insertase YidC [Verrucomicrobiae bacterium]
MDKKSIIIVAISFLLLVLWFPLTNRLWPPTPAPHKTNQIVFQTNVATTQTVATVTNQPTTVTPPVRATLVNTNAPEELAEIETDDARYIFTSHGGGLKTAELKRYPAVITCNDKGVSESNRVRLNTGTAVPVLAVLGSEALLGDGLFQLTRDGQIVRAVKTLTNGLRITKEFAVSSNYLVTAKVRLENQSAQALALPAQAVAIGTGSALGARDDPTTLGSYWYNGEKKLSVDEPWFQNKGFGCAFFHLPSTPRTDYEQGNNNVMWADVHGQFFTIITVPKEHAEKIHVTHTQLRVATNDARSAAPPVGLQTSLIYPAAVLTQTQALEREFVIYAGPKEYKRLTRVSARLKTNIDAVMDYEGFFGWFAQVLLSSMNGLHSFGLNYAMAIIAITVIIKLLFWPLTNASTKSMKRMAALQPQMKAIQEKYKDNPQKMNREVMEFMKKNRVSPLGGCLPMMLQIPVFFGFFKMIRTAIELRGEQ